MSFFRLVSLGGCLGVVFSFVVCIVIVLEIFLERVLGNSRIISVIFYFKFGFIV